MTPEQLEHLRKIDAHLEKLLAEAEKRTPNRWGVWGMSVLAATINSFDVSTMKSVCSTDYKDEDGRPRTFDATFIASCAGNAEAGWKTLRDEVREFIEIYEALPAMVWMHAEKRVASILAAFPLELLQ
jgi:hypothetical protein